MTECRDDATMEIVRRTPLNVSTLREWVRDQPNVRDIRTTLINLVDLVNNILSTSLCVNGAEVNTSAVKLLLMMNMEQKRNRQRD